MLEQGAGDLTFSDLGIAAWAWEDGVARPSDYGC